MASSPGRCAILAAAVCLGMTGCASGDDALTGSVTTLSPAFCVGTYAAAGDCFDVKAAAVAGLRVGDCVRVTYRPEGSAARPTATTVTKISDGSPTASCPPARGS